MLGAFHPAKSSVDTNANKRESANENMQYLKIFKNLLKVRIQMLFKSKLDYFKALKVSLFETRMSAVEMIRKHQIVIDMLLCWFGILSEAKNCHIYQ